MDHCCVILSTCSRSRGVGFALVHLQTSMSAVGYIKFLSRPNTVEEGHYKPFSGVYRSSTPEKYCPSVATPARHKKMLPFASNLRHVRNMLMMLQCKECENWQLRNSRKKLTVREHSKFEQALSEYVYM